MVGAAETPYDLRFRLLGIPVRVHPLFWLVIGRAGLAGPRTCRWSHSGWRACFVSILVHEYGHGLMAKALRLLRLDRPLGDGRACATARLTARRRSQRLAVVLSGPGAGFVLYFVVMSAHLGLLRPHARRTLERQSQVGCSAFRPRVDDFVRRDRDCTQADCLLRYLLVL